MSYKNLEIWKLAKEASIEVHKMTLHELPKFEHYEVGSQITYQAELYKHIVYSLASNDETTDHLETLFETGLLKNEMLFQDLKNKLEVLGKKLNLFLKAVERNIHPTRKKR